MANPTSKVKSQIPAARRTETSRPGVSAAAGCLCLALGLTPPPAQAFDWQTLWLNDDQRAAGRMEKEEYGAAAETFRDESWRATAWYRAGEYGKAAEAWSTLDDTEAHYNRGNALARAGNLHEAAAAYETVLSRDPDHADARHNLEVIRERMQDSENQSEEQEKQDSENQQNSEQQQQNQGDDQQDQRDREQRSQSDNQQGENSEQQQSRQETEPPDQQERREQQAKRNENQGEERQQQPEQPREQDGQDQPQPAGQRDADTPQPEERAATEQWLRRIPDDPGGLLRRKFRYQYGQRRRGDEPVTQPW